jgi:multisubunit Na+/H+ antiporter MnhG subunit
MGNDLDEASKVTLAAVGGGIIGSVISTFFQIGFSVMTFLSILVLVVIFFFLYWRLAKACKK